MSEFARINRSNTQRRRVSTGLTLLEMLVVLSIMAMVATLVSESLAQMARIERLLQGTRLETTYKFVQAAWLGEALESLLPTDSDSPQRFIGAERRLSGLTTAPPADQPLGIARIELSLVYLPRSDETELRMALADPQEDLPPGQPPLEERVIARWAGRTGYFRYLDATGHWLPAWNPMQAPAPVTSRLDLLPEAILLVSGQHDVRRLIVHLRVSPAGMPLRRSLNLL